MEETARMGVMMIHTWLHEIDEVNEMYDDVYVGVLSGAASACPA